MIKNLFSNFKGDLFGGITAGIVALPLALAFGVSSGLGPTAGLYGAIFLSFFAALLGGTNTQISGPTAPMTAVSMIIIASIIAVNDGDVGKALPTIVIVFLMAGIFQVLLGVLKLGTYIKYIPYPVVSGFMTAIGVIILITQILPAIGYYAKEDMEYVNTFSAQAQEEVYKKILVEEEGEGILVLDDLNVAVERAQAVDDSTILTEAKSLAGKSASGVLGTLRVLPNALSKVNFLELGITLLTIFIIYGFKRITTVVPSTLVALLVVSGLAYGVGVDYRPISEIPSGLPIPHFEAFTNISVSSFTPYIFAAITLSLLGAIDSLLTSVVADNLTKTKHNPNKELIGQGVGNSIGALFGGLPGAGATIRTVVNIKAGGKTKLSGMIAGIMLLVILLGLSPVASKIPAAVLAGILITVGIGVMDYKGLKILPKMPKDLHLGPFKMSSEVLIMLTVLILSSFWNLVNAVGIGLIMASLIFMKKMGDLTDKRSSIVPLEKEKRWTEQIGALDSLKEEVFVENVKGPLFFGSISAFQELTNKIPETASIVVVKMTRMQYIDQSGLLVIEEFLKDLKGKGTKLLLVGIPEQPKYMMKKINIIPSLVSQEQIFDCSNDFLEWMNKSLKTV